MHPYPAPLAIDYEHICLTSEEPEEPVPVMSRGAISAELAQSRGRVDRRYAIYNRSYLGVRTAGGSARTQSYSLQLAFLDPVPTRPTGSPWWGVAAALALLTSGLVLGGWFIAGYAALAAALLSLGLAVHQTFDRLIFYTRHGRVPLVQLLRGRSDRRQVKAFVAALQRAIRDAAAERSGLKSRLLRDEMKEHRRLLDAGVLQPPDFEAAKARILRAHG